MSVIRVDNFGPSAGGTTYSADGIAKFWAYFDGTGTASIQDSNNASSLTDNGTGDFTADVLNDFAAAPAVTFGVGTPAGTSVIKSTTVSTTSVGIRTFDSVTGTLTNYPVNTASGMGDLA